MSTYKSIRVTNKVKEKIKLIKKEILRVDPKLEQMSLSENYLLNRIMNFYLKDSPFRGEIEDEY